MAQKVFVIGLDGATFDVIFPLINKGELPNFERMMTKGVWGELESTIPPFSGPSWVSFQTGKTPANHGIFDFINKRPHSYNTYYINSTHVKGPRFWDILSDYGLKVGIINVMVTYPPSPVNGFLLTGGLTPLGRPFSYPPELGKEIIEKFGYYPLLPVGGIHVGGRNEKSYIKTFFDNEDKRITIAKFLMKTREWDFFMVMLEGADPLQHELWKYIDKTHPRYNPNVEEYIKNAIPNFYKKVDKFLGECMEKLGSKATICVMSDHGFGPLNRYILVNNFLMNIGMLRLKTNPVTVLKKLILNHGGELDRVYNLAKELGFTRVLSTFRGGANEKVLSQLTLSTQDIDWGKTKAFAVGTGGHIYLNVKGKEPEGIVNPGKEYRRVRNYIVENLKSLTDPKTGKKVIDKVFTKDELHCGKFFEEAPDISFLPCKDYCTLHREQFVSSSVFIDSPNCGTHRINGIVLFYGPDIREGKQLKGAKIYDLAPTILHLFGLPTSVDMDGEVLVKILKNSSGSTEKGIICQEESYEKKYIRNKLKYLKNKRKYSF